MELFDKKYVYFMWDKELEGKKVFASNNIYQLIVNVDTNNDGCLRENFIKEEFDKQWWKFVYYDPNYDVKWSYYKENKKVQAKLKDFPEAEWKNIERPQWESNYEWRIQPEETVSESFAKKDELIEEYCIKPEPEKELNNRCKWCKGKGCNCGSCANKDEENSYYSLHKEKFPEHIPEDDEYERIGQHLIDKQNLKEYRTRFYRPFKDCDELIEYWINKWGDDCCISFIKPLIWVRNKEFKTTHLITSFGEIKETNIQVVEISNMNFTMKELFDSFEFLNGSPCGVEETK